jgi:lincosamide nucleotidyltransferase A/C/D/E
MQASTVAMIVSGLEAAAIAVWVDGGWCIDALLGRQSRPHSDLDLAVDRRNVERLCGGWRERPAEWWVLGVTGAASSM